jgi:asparagine synthetase B (glutamine-hydrolysing)
MTHTQIHRGPDGSGVYPKATGINRSDTGKQTMAKADSVLWTIYNGGIYYFADLRAALWTGDITSAHAPILGLAHAMRRGGKKNDSPVLQWMFAFALYDGQTPAPRLIFAKDQLGRKLLDYAWNSLHFLFASEIKVLPFSGQLDRQPNSTPSWLISPLAYCQRP